MTSRAEHREPTNPNTGRGAATESKGQHHERNWRLRTDSEQPGPPTAGDPARRRRAAPERARAERTPAGRLAAENTPILTGLEFKLDSKQELTRINRAVNRTADALGLGDVMVRTTAGTHNGVFGMYMELAPGAEARRLAHDVGPRFDAEGTRSPSAQTRSRRFPPTSAGSSAGA